MKTSNIPSHLSDEVIAEVHRHKEEIAAEHNFDIRVLFAGLRERQRFNPRLVSRETKTGAQTGAGQPATRPVDEPEGGVKPQPEAEGRSR
jgi:hypothetical protein